LEIQSKKILIKGIGKERWGQLNPSTRRVPKALIKRYSTGTSKEGEGNSKKNTVNKNEIIEKRGGGKKKLRVKQSPGGGGGWSEGEDITECWDAK